ncbi:tRNA pseudouridine(38-40) synthase TruA [Parvularcula dongshanensis]|uniref:tRNA pseudouridine synthase A n=1 Tax=Parvularcula dongshanensis TaxID=1173995 RepID=A0A840HZN9_9PROT|nr:tRNA pseudouridine(38-40) synthase TruA [Parvularcula dongshanensis]MBB4658306.1 tRNA pseudouridine38-40 synthase [Parvularcula dongshanensis]
MPRYRLTVEFDGTPFVGWQRQDNGPSVQGALEAAGEALTGAPAPVVGAGRTDAGVHALAMTAHIDLRKPFPARTVREALNAHLRPAPIAVLDAEEAEEGFHARFSCTGRSYLYRLLARRAPPALERERVWHVPIPLDEGAMAEGAKALIGRHDFTTFRSVHCQSRSPVKTLDEVRIERAGDEIRLHLAARSFLHNQVRSIAGTLERVGAGAWPPEAVGTALSAKDRAACGPVAPARGLYFAAARYDSSA